MRKNNRNYLAALMLFVGLAFYWTVCQMIQERHICFVKNVSESLPFSYFFGYKIKEPERGMYVTFEHPKVEILLAKRVAGLPDDFIAIRNRQVFINGIPLGYIQTKSPSGISLSPIHEGEIPKGYVYVAGSHPSSFDSRYAEFGLVAISQLKELLWPLF